MVVRIMNGMAVRMGYNAESRLVSVSRPKPGQVAGGVTASFAYDGDGNRVEAHVGTTTTSYIGNYVEWVHGTPGTLVTYYYAGSTRVAMRTNGTLNYLLGDHLGSQSAQKQCRRNSRQVTRQAIMTNSNNPLPLPPSKLESNLDRGGEKKILRVRDGEVHVGDDEGNVWAIAPIKTTGQRRESAPKILYILLIISKNETSRRDVSTICFYISLCPARPPGLYFDYFPKSPGPKAPGSSSERLASCFKLPAASATSTSVSRPNSASTWRQAPHGVPPLLVTTAMAVNFRSPSETALNTATRSAHMEVG